MRTDRNETISEVLQAIERLQNTVEALSMAAIQEAPKNYEALAMDAAMHGERMAVRLRDLVISTTTVSRRRYMTACAGVQGIRAVYENEILKVTLPRQLSKRRWKNSEFLVRPLMAAMSELSEQVKLPRLEKAAVCFVHVVDEALPASLIRDHDNIESKQALDVINACMLVDDSGLLCQTLHRTERGEENKTEIYVMAANDFPGWLTEREKGKIEYPK